MTVQSLINEIMSRDGRGRKPSLVGAVISRKLEAADMLKLSEPASPQQASPIRKLKHSHHNLARLLADGTREEEISSITGYTVAYISVIKGDPAFSSLVQYYAEQAAEKYLNVHERLSTLSMDCVDEIQSRLAEAPDSFQVRELKEIAEMGFDRTGFGKQTQVDHKHVVALVDPAQISRIKTESSQRSVVTNLISTPDTRSSLGPPRDEESISEAETVEGVEGAGDSVPEQSREVPETE